MWKVLWDKKADLVALEQMPLDLRFIRYRLLLLLRLNIVPFGRSTFIVACLYILICLGTDILTWYIWYMYNSEKYKLCLMTDWLAAEFGSNEALSYRGMGICRVPIGGIFCLFFALCRLCSCGIWWPWWSSWDTVRQDSTVTYIYIHGDNDLKPKVTFVLPFALGNKDVFICDRRLNYFVIVRQMNLNLCMHDTMLQYQSCWLS